MIYTLFFSALRDMGPDAQQHYRRSVDALIEHARDHHPGFVDIKTYTADDGERLSVVRFTDEAAQRAWKVDTDHREAQALGRSDFYDRYRIVVCEQIREKTWTRSRETLTEAKEGGSS